ncbi:DNA replication factor Dna2-domain-containing protein [Xylariaceae sp. FL0804]|nr:DNA replication factor Dna2-domain-containing protein [Xylariaceae sp. FL0804]
MPLQKSFSEQNSSSRVNARRTWHKSKTHPAAPGPDPRPLQPVSKATKNKLNAFNFRPTLEKAQETQEAEPITAHLRPVDQSVHASHSTVHGETQSPGEAQEGGSTVLSGAKNGTSTPVSRLAWQDLMRTSEAKDEEADTSPSERIEWDTRDLPAFKFTPMMPRQRGKKRARSSSPTSSPAPASKSNTPTVNVKKLSQALKSPHADPALELWDRFSWSGSVSTTPLGAANPALAQFMVPSSPQPLINMPSAVPSEGGLRRAISCGTHWPKRRRVERVDVVAPMRAVAEESPSRNSKSSMVNALLQSVAGEINPSAIAHAQSDASRSPSPRKRSQSPRRPQLDIPAQGFSLEKPAPPLFHEEASGTKDKAGVVLGQDNSSDYGDDDFDDDTLIELDASLHPAGDDAAISQQQGQQQQHHRQQQQLACAQAKASPPSVQVAGLDDEEFADSDDEIFAAAETIVSRVDLKRSPYQQPTSLPPPSVVAEPARASLVEEPAEDMYGDDFGGDFDFEAAESAATQSTKQPSRSIPLPAKKPKAIQRYLVTKVLQSQYTDANGREAPEKVLLVEVNRSKVMRTIHLRGDWMDTPASSKSYVHVIGGFEPSGQCIIDNSQNILILHPDQLISATVVADSFTCMRRAVLQDRVKATGDKSPPLVYGTLLHEIFQEALMRNCWSMDYLYSIICKITAKHVEDLYTIRVSMDDAREHLQSKMAELRLWAGAFVSAFPKVSRRDSRPWL